MAWDFGEKLRINCLHGYFIFEEQRSGEVSDFISLYGLDIVRKGNQFIFGDLEDAQDFSIKGKAYLDSIATKTFEGEPWEVFEENNLIYNFDKGLVVPISTVTNVATLSNAGNFFVADGLIMPGSITDDGRVTDYAAWFTTDTMKFKYSAVEYV